MKFKKTMVRGSFEVYNADGKYCGTVTKFVTESYHVNLVTGAFRSVRKTRWLAYLANERYPYEIRDFYKTRKEAGQAVIHAVK